MADTSAWPSQAWVWHSAGQQAKDNVRGAYMVQSSNPPWHGQHACVLLLLGHAMPAEACLPMQQHLHHNHNPVHTLERPFLPSQRYRSVVLPTRGPRREGRTEGISWRARAVQE